MFSKKVKLNGNLEREKISVATALVLLAIDELINEQENINVYGYQIMTHLREHFNWDVKSGTVYPILKKLQNERYIRSEAMVKKGSRRHQIFYILTKSGKKLVETIKTIDNQKLDAALSSDKAQSNSPTQPEFVLENISENYVAPFLLDLDNKISKEIGKSITAKNMERLNLIEKEIESTLNELNLCKSLLENEIEKIKKIKKMKI